MPSWKPIRQAPVPTSSGIQFVRETRSLKKMLGGSPLMPSCRTAPLSASQTCPPLLGAVDRAWVLPQSQAVVSCLTHAPWHGAQPQQSLCLSLSLRHRTPSIIARGSSQSSTPCRCQLLWTAPASVGRPRAPRVCNRKQQQQQLQGSTRRDLWSVQSMARAPLQRNTAPRGRLRHSLQQASSTRHRQKPGCGKELAPARSSRSAAAEPAPRLLPPQILAAEVWCVATGRIRVGAGTRTGASSRTRHTSVAWA
mmetsp:Transcript_146401/g.380552  ORF Transcript_146401/g.380552 Transcript_146401/m.380552 type:complete len:252 (+) Transcript_146401:441-1196(+)